MTTVVMTGGLRPRAIAETALAGAGRLWLGAVLVGQAAFLAYILGFYGLSTVTGDFQAWSRNHMLIKGYMAGDTAGNLAFATHVLLAAVVTLGGGLQLIPAIRRRAPAFHRWTGRVFLVAGMAASLDGLWMVWVRGAGSNLFDNLMISLNASLILSFGALAWRAAIARRFEVHRRWAFSAFLTVNGVWFLRVLTFGWIVLNHGPVGMGDNMDGPVSYAIEVAALALPPLLFALYETIRLRGGAAARLAMAGGLTALAAFMSVGAFGFSMVMRSMLGMG